MTYWRHPFNDTRLKLSDWVLDKRRRKWIEALHTGRIKLAPPQAPVPTNAKAWMQLRLILAVPMPPLCNLSVVDGVLGCDAATPEVGGI
jgi:hypothetical protein